MPLAQHAVTSHISSLAGKPAPLSSLIDVAKLVTAYFKVSAAGGWFAARASGNEDIYKIYAESFRGVPQSQQILKEAHATVDAVIARQCRAQSPTRVYETFQRIP